MKAAFSQRHKFSAWPNGAIPAVSAGVYVVWDGPELMYCGMAGREFQKAVIAEKKRYGLLGRLNSHASGRLSGNQFCVYVANKLVIPALRAADLARFRTGDLTLDALTRAYIRERFEYQYAVVPSSEEAFALERACRSGSVFGVTPFLNPI